MFPHTDTVYAVHTLHLQDQLQRAARQRLAATATETAGTRLLHVAVSNGLGRIAMRFGAQLRSAFAAPRSQSLVLEAGRADAAGAGLA